MATEDLAEYVRVKDKDTGNIFSVRRSGLPHGNYQELKQDALGPDDQPLPPEFPSVDSSTTKKES